MPAVETVGDPQQPREPPHDRLLLLGEPGEFFVFEAGPPPPVIAAQQRDQVPVARGKIEPLGVHDELEAVLVVLPVAHHLADIVEEARRFENGALRLVGPQRSAEAVEEGEADDPDLFHVPPVPLAAFHEFPHCPEWVAGARRALADHLQQQPLPETEGAHRDAPRFDQAEQLGGHREPSQDDVGPLRIEPGHLAPLLEAQGAEPFEELLHFGRLDYLAVHRLDRVTSAVQRHPGQIGDGSPRADDGDVAPFPPAARLFELLPDLLPERCDLLAPGAAFEQIFLGEADRAERQRLGQLDQSVDGADELEAPASDVGHQRPPRRLREVVRHRAP